MKSVLVIEDNGLDLKLAVMGLHGFKVDAVTCFTDASEKMARHTYDAILTDLKLPDIDMNEVVSAIKKLCGKAAVMVLTGYEDRDVANKARKDNAVRVLVKKVHDKPVGALAHELEAGMLEHETCQQIQNEIENETEI